MPSIRVSDATYRAIAELTILPFRSTAIRQPDNSWLVPVAPTSSKQSRHSACLTKAMTTSSSASSTTITADH